jgi:hypothetical protein
VSLDLSSRGTLRVVLTVGANRGAQRRVQQPPQLVTVLELSPKVRVHPQRHGRVSEPHHPRHVDEVGALADQQRCERVPQIVEPRTRVGDALSGFVQSAAGSAASRTRATAARYVPGVVRDRHRAAWEDWGRIDPFWAILTEADARHGRWDVDRFFATGVDMVAAMLAHTQR